jgi:soluble lytic murein transglycosylase-like protein
MIGIAAVFALAATLAAAPSEYDRSRQDLRPVTVGSVLELSSWQTEVCVGTTLEMRGRVSGVVEGGASVRFLLQIEGGTAVVEAAAPNPSVVLGRASKIIARVESKERLQLVVAAFDVPAAEPSAGAAAPRSVAPTAVAQGSVAARPNGAVPAARAAVSSGPSRGGVSSAETVRRYADAVKYFNKRIDDKTALTIAGHVLNFSQEHGIDARLIMAVIAVESRFKPTATSPKGAMGLAQLMPGTAAGLGVRNAYNPSENIDGAVRLIKGYLSKYDGNPDQLALALASYNAGSGAVRKYGGVPPYRETQNYIRKVHDLYAQFCR